MDEQETLDQMLAILDANIVRQAYQVAGLVWPDRRFGSRKSAGVAAQKYLTKLAHQGLAVTAYRGWRKIELPKIPNPDAE